MIRELLRKAVGPFFVMPGDQLQLTYTYPDGETVPVAAYTITEAATYDTAIIFEVENEFGLKNGLGGIFGKRE